MLETESTFAALSMQAVSKRFPGTLAVDNVDLEVRVGEVHALMGENGAGKSTLMKILTGAFDDYAGAIRIGGKQVRLDSPAAAKQHGIGMVYQELSLARPISVAENLLAGRLPTKRGGILDRKQMLDDARRCLEFVGLAVDPLKTIDEISQHEAQLVEIAKVLGNAPCILIFDEPTSALSRDEVQRLFTIIRDLKRSGLAIVYISHHLPEVFQIADRVTVLRDGHKMGTCDIAETTPQTLVQMMVGESIDRFYAKREAKPGAVALRVEHVSRYGFFHDVSFQIRQGEILGLVGLSGAGRTELARSLCGLEPRDCGTVEVLENELESGDYPSALAKGLVYLTEDRKVDGLFLRLSVKQNLLAALLPFHSKAGFYRSGNDASVTQRYLNELDIVAVSPEVDVGTLSGGNQQKVLLGKWLATRPNVLILDEPTRGVDVKAKMKIHEAVTALADQGTAVLLISSDLPELVGLSDRAIVMRNGRRIGEMPKEALSEEAVLLAANGQRTLSASSEERGSCYAGCHPQAVVGLRVRNEAACHPKHAPSSQLRLERGTRKHLGLSSLVETAGIYVVAAFLAITGSFVSPEFLTVDNLFNVLSAVALLGIVATGMAFVTYSGSMADLSVPAIMAFSGIIAIAALPLGLAAALVSGILAGMAIGTVNGLVVGKLNANPILWTLAVAFFMEGFMRFTWSNTQVYPDTQPGTPGDAFTGIFRMHLGPVPLVVITMFVLFVVAHLAMTRTRFGRESRLVGSSRATARASGIRVSRVVCLNFMAASLAASMAGIFITSMNKLGVFYLGQGYDFKAVTAVVIGGVALSGGRGHIPGVFGGVLVIGLLTNIMTFLGITSFRQNIVTGIVFIMVVGLQQYQLRAKGKDYV